MSKFISPNLEKNPMRIRIDNSLVLASLPFSLFIISLSKYMKLEYWLSLRVYRLSPHKFPMSLIDPIPLYIILDFASQLNSDIDFLNLGASIVIPNCFANIVPS